jgi:hypothetical protein
MLLLSLFEQIPLKKFAMYGYMYGQKLFNSPKVPYSVQVPTTCDMKSAWISENLITVWSITKLAQYPFPDKLDNVP